MSARLGCLDMKSAIHYHIFCLGVACGIVPLFYIEFHKYMNVFCLLNENFAIF